MRKVILLIETASSYARGLLQGILEYSRINGPWTFYREPIAPFYRDRDRVLHIERMKKWGADGIITRLPANIRTITSLHLPIISTDDNQQHPHSPCVISDYQAAGKMAAGHLLERGFKHFAYCGFSTMFWSQERGRSFGNFLKQNGYEVNFYKYPHTKSQQLWENESALLIEWLESLPKPVGIMACNDDRGQQVIEACRTAGLYVPEEVAVVGVDNDTFLCGLSNPTLSSVDINTTRAGYEAAQLLDHLMNKQKPDNEIIVAHPTHIVTRQSSEILATEDIMVMKAIHFIRQNARKSIQVTDVAKKVALSRRTLLDRFQKVLGRTIQEEIRRVRIERISQLLLETDLPIYQIALKMDFTSIEHISRYFQQEKGMSPLTFRKKYSSSLYSKDMASPDAI
jgi:LacI family transcriptional regulator